MHIDCKGTGKLTLQWHLPTFLFVIHNRNVAKSLVRNMNTFHQVSVV